MLPVSQAVCSKSTLYAIGSKQVAAGAALYVCAVRLLVIMSRAMERAEEALSLRLLEGIKKKNFRIMPNVLILKFFFCIVLMSASFADGCVGIIWRSISFRS